MYQKILIPTDGSDLCWKAAQEGIRFAKANDAKVVAFHAIPTTSYMLFPESGPSDSIIDRFEKEAENYMWIYHTESKNGSFFYPGRPPHVLV